MGDSQQDREVSVEEMLRDVTASVEPGGYDNANNRIVARGDTGEGTAPMIVSSIKSAGWVYVWDNITGERSIVNRNMLVGQLAKRREDGSLVFTTRNPGITPWRGEVKCILHPDDPNRRAYDDLGLAVCKKSNMPNTYQMRRHMEKRHKAEFAAIQEIEKDAKERETRTFQESLMKQMTNQSGGASVTRRKAKK